MEEFFKEYETEGYEQKMLEGTLTPVRHSTSKFDIALLTDVVIPRKSSGRRIRIECVCPEITMLDYFLVKYKERIEYSSEAAWRKAQKDKPRYYSAFMDMLVDKPSYSKEADYFDRNHTL